MPTLSPTLSIDLFADIVCPWCYIGTAHLDAALATLASSDGVTATITHHPFLLDPTTPPEGVNLAERLQKKYGGDPRTMFARVEQAGRAAGLALDFTRVTHTYPTVAAHTLLRHAAPRGTQRALVKALYAAYFDEGRNIADAGVLADLASHHGFERDEAQRLASDENELARTRAEAEAGPAQGIRGVPFFIFNRRLAVSARSRLMAWSTPRVRRCAPPRRPYREANRHENSRRGSHG